MWLVTVEEITDKLFKTMDNFLLWSSLDIKHLSSTSTYHSACQIHLLANERLIFGLTNNLKTKHAIVTSYCMNYIIIIIVRLCILDNQPYFYVLQPWKSYRKKLFEKLTLFVDIEYSLKPFHRTTSIQNRILRQMFATNNNPSTYIEFYSSFI